jgi:hypothetical protein
LVEPSLALGAAHRYDFVSLICWFFTAEKSTLRKPVVKKQRSSSALIMKLSQFSLILIVSPLETSSTLQYCKKFKARTVANLFSPVYKNFFDRVLLRFSYASKGWEYVSSASGVSSGAKTENFKSLAVGILLGFSDFRREPVQ